MPREQDSREDRGRSEHREQHRNQAHEQHDDAGTQEPVSLGRVTSRRREFPVPRDRRRRDQELAVGGRHDCGQNRRDHDAGDDRRKQIAGGLEEDLFAVGNPIEENPSAPSDQEHAGVDQDCPGDCDEPSLRQGFRIAQRHEPVDDVWLSRVPEADPESPGDECEREQAAPGPEESCLPGRRDLGEAGKESTESADADQCDDRKNDRRADHEKALEGVGHAHGPEAAEQGVDQDDGRADRNARVRRKAERRRERVPRGLELCRDVEHEREENRDGGDSHHAREEPVRAIAGEKLGESQTFVLAALLHQTRSDPQPVDQKPRERRREEPDRRESPGVGRAADAEKRPRGGRARRCAHCGDPRTELSPSEEEVTVVVGATARPDPDGDQRDLVAHESDEDRLFAGHDRRV